MTQTKTTYRLAQGPADYKLCHALLRATEQPEVPFGFPTVMAEREDVIVGFLGTIKTKGAVIAGPLSVDPTIKNPGQYALRLIEVYESVLQRAGVESYLFSIDTSNQSWLAAVQKRGFQPYASTETDHWFQKRVSK